LLCFLSNLGVGACEETPDFSKYNSCTLSLFDFSTNGFLKEVLMRAITLILTQLFLMGVITGVSLADDFYVFPSKGQSNDQMNKDKAECVTWATRQSGFDPMAAPTATSPPPKTGAPKGGAVRGGLRGAAVGAAIGSMSGDMGEGAAIGAAAGGLLGGMRRRDQQQQEENAKRQWEEEQRANYARNRDSFNRAYKLCLEAKGYSVTPK
jgi:outer membrane protein with glycine zipper